MPFGHPPSSPLGILSRKSIAARVESRMTCLESASVSLPDAIREMAISGNFGRRHLASGFLQIDNQKFAAPLQSKFHNQGENDQFWIPTPKVDLGA